MGRPKKVKPNRTDGRYEYKLAIGKKIDGTIVRKSFYSYESKEDAKRQAEEWEIEKEVATRTNTAFITKDMSFAVWATKWLEVYKKPKVTENTFNGTYRLYVEKYLIPFFGQADLKNIRPADIQLFYSAHSGLSSSALHKISLCFNGIFETAIDNDLCIKNPARFVTYVSEREPEQKQIYTEEQIAKLYQRARTEMPGIVIILETGLRCGELMGLQWKDIKDGVLYVNRSIAVSKLDGYEIRPPKWNSYRAIPLSPEAASLLSSLKNDDIYVLPYKKDTPYTPRAWAKKLSRYMEKVHKEIPEIPVLSAHELRHTYGTRLRRRGVDIYTIQKVMGHKDINVTAQTYVHNEIDALKQALNLTKLTTN